MSKWKDVRFSTNSVRVRCPECGAIYTLPIYSLRGRRRWKCCPICEVPIDGAEPKKEMPEYANWKDAFKNLEVKYEDSSSENRCK